MFATMHRRFVLLRNLLLGSVLLVALEVAFAAFTLTETTTPSLGTFFSGASGRNFILNTDETVSGTDAAEYLFGAVSGQLSLVGQNATVTIVAEFITTSGGLTVNNIPCRYHTGSQTTCDGSGISAQVKKNIARTLFVGVDLDTNQEHSGGDTASVTYDITVNFP